jgi:hypothetical protein
MSIFEFARKGRVIDFLRKHFPGDWRYVPEASVWVRTDNNNPNPNTEVFVYKEAQCYPRYDGDDDNFVTFLRIGSPINKRFWWGRK